MHINKESKEVEKDCAVDIPPSSIQFIKNTGDEDLEFLSIVCPPYSIRKMRKLFNVYKQGMAGHYQPKAYNQRLQIHNTGCWSLGFHQKVST